MTEHHDTTGRCGSSLVHRPRGPLGSVVESIWYSEATAAAGREHSLPSGQTHVAIRLDGPPLLLYDDPAGRCARPVGRMVVAGVRAGFSTKEAAAGRTVGVQLRPSGATALFGVSAGELSGCYTPLGDVMEGAADLGEELAALVEPAAIVGALAAALAARVRPMRALHPDVAAALQHSHDVAVAELVAMSGRSHRSFTARFRDAVGLTPKKYARVCRFRQLLVAARRSPEMSWGLLAARAGYADQAHMNRDFAEFAGVTPNVYRRSQPRHDLHLPIGTAGR